MPWNDRRRSNPLFRAQFWTPCLTAITFPKPVFQAIKADPNQLNISLWILFLFDTLYTITSMLLFSCFRTTPLHWLLDAHFKTRLLFLPNILDHSMGIGNCNPNGWNCSCCCHSRTPKDVCLLRRSLGSHCHFLGNSLVCILVASRDSFCTIHKPQWASMACLDGYCAVVGSSSSVAGGSHNHWYSSVTQNHVCTCIGGWLDFRQQLPVF